MEPSAAANQALSGLPAGVSAALARQLQPGERPLAWLKADLDERLNYHARVVVLTDRRLLEFDPVACERKSAISSFDVAPPQALSQWPIRAGLRLDVTVHRGAGTLALRTPDEPPARTSYEPPVRWNFTAGSLAAAQRLAKQGNTILGALQALTTADLNVGQSDVAASASEPDVAAEVKTAPQSPLTTLARLARFARPRAGMISLGIALTTAATAASLVPPYLTMPLLDRVLVPYQEGKPADFGLVRWYLGGLAAAAVLAWLLGWAKTYTLAWVSERIGADLRNRTYEHLHRLSLEFFGRKRTGDLISRVSSDTDRICYFLSVYMLDFITDLLMIIMTAVILVTIDPVLAVATLLPLPLIAYTIQHVRNRLRRGFQLGTMAWGEMTSVLADTIPGIRVVKAFAQERREVERFHHSNDRILHANDRVNTVWSFYRPLITLLTEVGLLVIWIVGVWQVFHHNIKVGVLVAFIAYISRFYTRLDAMSRMVAAVQRAAASAHRIFDVLNESPSVPEPARPVHPGRLCGEIELRHVGFRYGERVILDDVSLRIAPGEMIGLVGPSGAGKTTLVNLVCRFYDVGDGAVLVDGHDIRSFPIAEFRRNVGIVLQEPFLFYGTIAENIAYGRSDAPRNEIVAAARAARAHDFILRQLDAYDSLVGERGQSLSGGERQRISIARALLIDPRILILDEATSSVDTETEREIQLALENLIEGRTTIAIAHRLSTLRRADRLVVLDAGRIVEVGPHDELLAAGGLYARLYHAQREEEAATSPGAEPSTRDIVLPVERENTELIG